MVCAPCAEADQKAKLKHFLDYCSEYEKSIAREEEENFLQPTRKIGMEVQSTQVDDGVVRNVQW